MKERIVPSVAVCCLLHKGLLVSIVFHSSLVSIVHHIAIVYNAHIPSISRLGKTTAYIPQPPLVPLFSITFISS